jgi:hypothetical protein
MSTDAGIVSKALALRKSLTPEQGYNLVGQDTFQIPGEDLYLIKHYDTREEALRAQKLLIGDIADAKTYIFPVDDDDAPREAEPEKT